MLKTATVVELFDFFWRERDVLASAESPSVGWNDTKVTNLTPEQFTDPQRELPSLSSVFDALNDDFFHLFHSDRLKKKTINVFLFLSRMLPFFIYRFSKENSRPAWRSLFLGLDFARWPHEQCVVAWDKA